MRRLPVWPIAALLAGAVFLPFLGAPGLVDPWEPHYAEVSRQMLLRSDWVHPWWREAGFFSKPPLVLWGGAAGLALLGEGAAEWAVRLPVALAAVLGLAVSAEAVSRLSSRRAGLLAAAAFATSPVVALLARQAIPDAPFALLSTAGGLALAVALLDDGAGRGWAAAGWILLAFATLAKGPLGFLLPAGALLAWLVVTGDWRRAPRLAPVERVAGVPVPVGPAAFLAIVVPWFAAMAAWPGRDESGWTFVQRFWLYDHLRRFGPGAHVPVPGGGFLPYLGWIAVGAFPWIAAVPGGLGEALRTRGEPRDARGGLALLCALWAGGGWLLVGLAATRYPHYVLPVVLPLLVLAALFLDRLVEEGPGARAVAVFLGAAALAATGWALARSPRLLTAIFTYDPRRSWPGAALDALHPEVRVGPVALSARPGSVLGAIAAAALAGLAIAAVRRSGRLAAASLLGAGLASGAWVAWVHQPEVAAHWTQREVFARLGEEHPGPGEPVVAWLMNWRGETFYGRNRVREVADPARMREIAGRSGRFWVVTEAERLPSLEGAVGGAKRIRVAEPVSGRYRLVELSDPAPGGGARP